jgi:spore coat polysaccharide biosynthesis protein SpsF
MENKLESGYPGIIIQARMGSTRLPGKVLMSLKGRTVLEHVIERVKSVSNSKIIVATTKLREDDQIVDLINKLDGVFVFRGSSDDVLSRYLGAADKYGIETIVRITADCPLIDPFLISEGINIYLSKRFDIVTNAGPNNSMRTFPRGLDFEIFSTSYLKSIANNSLTKQDKEHVTPAIYRNSKNQKFIYSDIDNSDIRITLDTIEDYKLISRVYGSLYTDKHDFFYRDIVHFLRKNSDLMKLNMDVKQKDYNE